MKRAIARLFVAGAGVMGVVSGALGQAASDPPKPPPIQATPGPNIFLVYGVALVGILICVALAAFPGRRSFED